MKSGNGENNGKMGGTDTTGRIPVKRRDSRVRVDGIDTTIGGRVKSTTSDGSTASYYELPDGAEQLQDLISFRNMNSQLGEIGRAWYRYGQDHHSSRVRELKKIRYYCDAELERLAKYENEVE